MIDGHRERQQLRWSPEAHRAVVAAQGEDALLVAVQAPVEARFRCDKNGSTGIEVEVRLDEPSQADAATAALTERFPDPLSSIIVR